VILQAIIFLLKSVYLPVQLLVFDSLLLIAVNAVASKDHVVSEKDRQYYDQPAGDPPPHSINGSADAPGDSLLRILRRPVQR
jgi:hypothetical protein